VNSARASPLHAISADKLEIVASLDYDSQYASGARIKLLDGTEEAAARVIESRLLVSAGELIDS
jgi:hypothetical protein